jgi:hypothetical protein
MYRLRVAHVERIAKINLVVIARRAELRGGAAVTALFEIGCCVVIVILRHSTSAQGPGVEGDGCGYNRRLA